ncbi:MAG: lamin tail domain-containing protein [Verrucomicrobiota bacterium]
MTAGSLLREVWENIPGNSINDLTSDPRFPNLPSFSEQLTGFFETPTDFAEQYGQRVHGYIVPPVTGNYTFWIASDDNGALYLSTDNTPAKQQLICSVPDWTASRQWDKFPDQQSAPIRLVAGQAYYIRALHKEGNGGDNLAVRWLRPDGLDEAPIPATYLLPYGTSFTPPIIKKQPSDLTVMEGEFATFTIEVQNLDAVSYEWSKNGKPIPSPGTATLRYGPVTLQDNTAKFRAHLTNSLGAVDSDPATLTVTPDNVPPKLTAVYNLGTTNVQLFFSEPIAAAGASLASNFQIDGSITVTAARPGTDPSTIVLTTSPLKFGTNYTVTVNGLKDQANTPNPLPANSRISFTAAEFVSASVGSSPVSTVVKTLAKGGFEITAAGSEIGGTSDEFGFAWQLREGDFDLQVRVGTLRITDPFLQAGLMARTDLTTNAPFAGIFTGSAQAGVRFLSRATSGSTVRTATPAGGFPYNGSGTWLRLKRTGDTLSGYAGWDGVSWTPVGSAPVTLGSPVYVGLAASSRKSDSAMLARFHDFGPTLSEVVDPVVITREPPGPTSRRTGLVFSEIMYHPGPTPGVTNNLEFVEIFNAGSVFEDIGGWTLDGAVQFTFPAGFRLEAGALVLISADPLALQNHYLVPGGLGPWTGSLKNGGERVELKDNTGSVKLSARYSPVAPWPAAADGGGHSLVLTHPSYGEADPRAWEASDAVGGSPGTWDPVRPSPLQGVVINEFLAHTDDPVRDFVELYNGSGHDVDLGGCVLTDDPSTNRFRIRAGITLPARGHLSFTQDELGFALSAAGETLLLYSPDGTRVLDAVRFGPQENGVSSGRTPSGAPTFRRLESPTPGAANAPWRHESIVITEIMFNPITGQDDDQFVELYNRTAGAVDLSGWRFVSGIDFEFAPGTLLPGGSYLAVAKNVERLRATHPKLAAASVRGNFQGSLSKSGERISLAMPDDLISTNKLGDLVTNQVHIVVSEAIYADEGRWSRWADGGGSSLELTDAQADPLAASNWADSDESGKAEWTSLAFTGRLDNGNEAYPPDRIQIGLQGAGECLVDNVTFSVGGGANLVANSGFEIGTGWQFAGNHFASRYEAGAGVSGGRALRIVAQGDGDTGPNCVRSPLTSIPPTGGQGNLQIQARWQRGWPELLVRTRGGWIELAGRMKVPLDLGSPGAVNSRRVDNTGPVVTEVRHTPALPAAGQPVVVTARVEDPDTVGTVRLRFRTDPGGGTSTAVMHDDGVDGDAVPGDGIYSARLSGRSAGVTLAFRIEASDAATTPVTTVFPPAYPASEALIRWGDAIPVGSFAHYHLWATEKTVNDFNAAPGLNNRFRDATLVVGGHRVIYGIGFRSKGSPYHGGRGDFAVTVPADDRLLGMTDRVFAQTGNGDAEETGMRGQIANWMARRLGIPYLHGHYMRLYVNGSQYSNVMEDLAQPNNDLAEGFFPAAGTGDLYKVAIWFEFNDDDNGFQPVQATTQAFSSPGQGLKLARYRWNWQTRGWLGTANNYTNIFNLIQAANASENYAASMSAIADMEEWMRVFAFNRITGNWDAWTYNVGQNMYLYFQPGERAKLIPWDIDFVFGLGEGSNTALGGGNLGGNCQDPVGNRFYDEPAFRRALWRAFADAINGPLRSAEYQPQISARSAVLKNNGFLVGGSNGLRDPRGISTYIEARRAFIQQQLTAADKSFGITSNGGNDFVSSQPVATLNGTAPFAVAVIEVNGVPYPVTWTSANAFRITVPLTGPSNPLSLVGYDLRGNPVPGAADTISVTYTGVVPKAEDFVVINEIQFDPATSGTSFVELYNRSTSTPFDLSGWRLDGLGYTFPEGSLLATNSYWVLARDRKAFALAYGATVPVFDEFDGSLDNGGETLRLVKPASGALPEIVVSDVRYDDDPPWPPSAAGQGPSLQLVDPTRDTYRVGNWAATSPGDPDQATPGRANSVRRNLDPFPAIWINEVLAHNVNGPTDNVGEREPFIELFNSGNTDVDLSAFRLGTNSTTLSLWTFPAGTVLRAGSFLRIWADGESAESAPGALHTSFRLNPDTGLVLLSRVQGTPPQPVLMDYLSYSQLPAGRSAGSFPDGEPRQRRTFSKVTPGAANDPAFPPVGVVINEFMASNQKTITNPFTGKRDDWFELYNGGNEPVDLTGYFLTDVLTNANKFEIPPGFVIPPSGFLLVWADEATKGNTNGSLQLHVNFKLSIDGEDLGLYAPDGALVDGLSFHAQADDVSLGRFPDGAPGPMVVLDTASPAAANELAGGNRPPKLDAIPPTSVLEGSLLRFTVHATDDPAQSLRYSLGPDAPAGTRIDESTGVFSWTPTEAQGPGVYTFTVRASDNGTPSRTGGTPVTITVNEFNQPPEIVDPGPQSVDERSLLRLHIEVRDSDLPANEFTFALEEPVPAGLTLAPVTGDMTWIPGESQGPGSYTVHFLVTDNGTPPASSRGSVTITVNEVNNPPDFAEILPQTVDEGQPFVLQMAAFDPDATAAPVTYSLDGTVPPGLVLDSKTGRILWNPGESEGPGTYILVVRATEQNAAALSSARTFSITVREVNQAPQLTVPTELRVGAGETVRFRATGSDADLPAQHLRYSLDAAAPPGSAIDPVTGEFVWATDADAVGATVEIPIRVEDDGPGSLGASATVRVVITPRFQVVIQEIMAQPPTAKAAYIELGNASRVTPWDISGYRLQGDSLQFTFPANTRLEPGAALCVIQDSAAFVKAYGGAPRVAGSWTGTLGVSGDFLRLLPPQPATVPVNAVRFRPGAPWPLAAAGGGASLQLVDPTRDTARVGNWSGPPAYTGPRQLVLMTNQWHYFQAGPADAGWQQPDFVDTAWPVGRGLFYVETAPLPAPKLTPLTLGQTTYYFRSTFVLPDVPAGASLKLSWVVDDGAVFYLNGTEIHRWNIASDAVVNFTTPATPNVTDAVLSGPIVLPASALRAGTNVFAVEVHQAKIPGGDVVFGCTLNLEGGDLPGFTPGAPNNIAARRSEFPPIWINEVLPSNTTGRTDSRGDRDPWIELVNTGPDPVSLDGWQLSDSYAQLKKWAFPADIVVPPRGFLIVFADGEPGEGSAAEPHTSFRLTAGSGSVALSRGAAGVADYVDYSDLKANESLASRPDGQPFVREKSAAPTAGIANEPNRAPVLDPVGPQSLREDGFLNIALHASDPDLGQQLTYRLVGSTPSGMKVDPDSGLLTWIPGEADGPGTFTVQVEVSDDAPTPLTDRKSIGITVTEVNRKPALFPVAEQSAVVGETVSFRVGAGDPDVPAQTLSFTLEGAPQGATLAAATGDFSWKPSAAQTGLFDFTVRVSDSGPDALSATTPIRIRVAAATLVVSVAVATDGTLHFTWPSSAGASYRLESVAELGKPWDTVTVKTGTGASLTHALPAPTGPAFYRVTIP